MPASIPLTVVTSASLLYSAGSKTRVYTGTER